jgi:histidine triad (HIT) family protein
VTACAFCEIVAGRRPADLVFGEADAVGFLDSRPLFPGHTLLVPREHHETLDVLPESLLVPLISAAQRLEAAVRKAVDAEGTFLAVNNRVSQSVPHLHVHVVPRSRGDGLRGFFWPRHGYEDDAHRLRVAQAIRDALS